MYKTNKHKILVIIINRIILLNTSYYIIFAFLFKKIYKVYKWLFKYIKDFYKYFDILNSNIILTNAQNSLI